MPGAGPPRMTAGWWLFLAAFLGGIAALLSAPVWLPDHLRALEFSRGKLSALASEADPIVAAVRAHRAEHGEYPARLGRLSEAGRLGVDPASDEFRTSRAWDYLYRGTTMPPVLRTRLGYHATLIYEFAPSEGFYFPEGVNEGWVRRMEGDPDYLRPAAR